MTNQWGNTQRRLVQLLAAVGHVVEERAEGVEQENTKFEAAARLVTAIDTRSASSGGITKT
jgi:hypothetical protein